MSVEWLSNDHSKFLIVLCNGWGMDANPFRPIKTYNYDVVVLFDYTSELNLTEILVSILNHEKAYLLGWSMGVSFGQRLFYDHVEKFDKCIAVNGTLHPIDNDFGIPEDIFTATLQNMSDKAVEKFNRRMCRAPEIISKFTEHMPKRLLSNQITELDYIGRHGNCKAKDIPIYSHAIISNADYIIPTVNQLNFWQPYNYRLINGYHFPFYNYSSWDEMVDSFCNEK
jgi:biotin synthesis protein BioG